MGYISRDHQQNIRTYLYKGGTASITYTHIWSPLAELVLTLFPTWVAPNVITLSAFLILIVVHLVFMFVGDDSESMPDWKYYMMGISIFVYQTLDNVDGKQARRTKTSSPLGMLFDHGSDSITAFLLGFQMIIIMGIREPPMIVFLVFLFVGSTQFCALWTQYCTGVFRLGRINVVDQGLPSTALVCILAPVVGFDYYLRQQHIYGTYQDQLIYILTGLLLLQLFSINKNIHRDRIKQKSEVVYITLLPITTGATLIMIYLLGPQGIYNKIYTYVIYIFMFMFARNMILIQLCSVTQQKYGVFNRGTNFYLIAMNAFIVLARFTNFSVDLYFTVVLIVQFYLFVEFVYSAFTQAAQILNIKIFSIPSQKDKQKKLKNK